MEFQLCAGPYSRSIDQDRLNPNLYGHYNSVKGRHRETDLTPAVAEGSQAVAASARGTADPVGGGDGEDMASGEAHMRQRCL